MITTSSIWIESQIGRGESPAYFISDVFPFISEIRIVWSVNSVNKIWCC
ncbi:hypothetical protein [Mucilaginibacter sp.]